MRDTHPATTEQGPEWIRTLTLGAVGGVPLVGSLLAQVLNEVWVPEVQKRLLGFVDDFEHRLRDLERKIKGFSVTQLKDNIDFLDYAGELIPQAARTSDGARHEMLRNALLNTALHQSPADARALYYRELVRRFTPIHARVLRYLHLPPPGASTKRIDPREVEQDVARLVCSHAPDLKGQGELVRVVVRDLRSHGLLVFPHYVPPVLGPGQEKTYEMRGSRLSELGLGFLMFISDPESSEFQPPQPG